MTSRNDDLLARIDFADLYRRQAARSSFGMHSAAKWDKRAKPRSRNEKGSDYARQFLARMDLRDVETILDIGCGSGNLALPLARKVRRVYALDFSAEMLRLLRAGAKAENIQNLTVYRLAWEDDWRFTPKDVVICSRAMNVADLQPALLKMNQFARKRCYLTIHAGGSFISEDIYRVLRRNLTPRPNYMYAVNLLYQMGIKAKIDFLHTSGGLIYDTADHFVDSIQWRLGGLTMAERKRLLAYAAAEMPADNGGKLVHQHDFTWAFLSWDK